MTQYYHLSPSDSLEGKWVPRALDDEASNRETIADPEYGGPKISVGSSIEACFRGLYPSYSFLFDEKHKPHMDLFLYGTKPGSKFTVIDTAAIVARGGTYDAHATGECWIITPVDMVLLAELRFYSPKLSDLVPVFPYGNKQAGQIGVTPSRVKWSVRRKFNAAVKLSGMSGSQIWARA